MSRDTGSPLGRFLGVCFALFAGAAALYVAVHLIEAVATALLVILAVAGVIALAVAVLRSRRNGW